MTIMVFDIETVPDTVTGKRINNIDFDLDDQEVIKILQFINRQKKQGSEFLPTDESLRIEEPLLTQTLGC